MKIRKITFIKSITTVLGALSPLCVLASNFQCFGEFFNPQNGQTKTTTAGWLSSSGTTPTCTCIVGYEFTDEETYKVGNVKMLVGGQEVMWTQVLLSTGRYAESAPWERSSCYLMTGNP